MYVCIHIRVHDIICVRMCAKGLGCMHRSFQTCFGYMRLTCVHAPRARDRSTWRTYALLIPCMPVVHGSPFTNISPERDSPFARSSCMARQFNSVVFPLPLGPTMARILPGLASPLTPDSKRRVPFLLVVMVHDILDHSRYIPSGPIWVSHAS